MAPPRTGTIEPAGIDKATGKQKYRAKIRLADGSRAPVPVPLEKSRDAEHARGWATWRQEKEDKDGELMIAKRAKSARNVSTRMRQWLRELDEQRGRRRTPEIRWCG